MLHSAVLCCVLQPRNQQRLSSAEKNINFPVDCVPLPFRCWLANFALSQHKITSLDLILIFYQQLVDAGSQVENWTVILEYSEKQIESTVAVDTPRQPFISSGNGRKFIFKHVAVILPCEQKQSESSHVQLCRCQTEYSRSQGTLA